MTRITVSELPQFKLSSVVHLFVSTEFFTVDFGFLGMWDRLLHTSGKWRAMRAEVVKRNGLKKAA